MSHVEKTSWISALALALATAWYVYDALPTGTPSLSAMVSIVVVMVVIEIVANIVVSVLGRGEAGGGLDERERAIVHRADSVGFYVLASGAFTAAALLNLGFGTSLVFNFILGSLAAAEFAKLGMKIIGLRFGA
jgi:hypothetical protein